MSRPRAAVAAWLDGRWHDAGTHPRRPARPLADRHARTADGPPPRLLHRRRPEPPRPCRPLAAELRPRSSPDRLRPRHARVRARRVGPVRRAPRPSVSRRSNATPTTCGASMRSSTPTRCRARSTRASASCARARPTGAPATCSPCTTGGTSRCTCSRPAATTTRWRSTTLRCTTTRPTGVALEMLDASALLWRLTLDGVDTGDRYAAARRPRGRASSPTTRGTSSTTSTRWSRSAVPDGSTTRARSSSGSSVTVGTRAGASGHRPR